MNVPIPFSSPCPSGQGGVKFGPHEHGESTVREIFFFGVAFYVSACFTFADGLFTLGLRAMNRRSITNFSVGLGLLTVTVGMRRPFYEPDESDISAFSPTPD
jgi:hypothetical protein